MSWWLLTEMLLGGGACKYYPPCKDLQHVPLGAKDLVWRCLVQIITNTYKNNSML